MILRYLQVRSKSESFINSRINKKSRQPVGYLYLVLFYFLYLQQIPPAPDNPSNDQHLQIISPLFRGVLPTLIV